MSMKYSVDLPESERWLLRTQDAIRRECGSDVFHAIQEELSERRWVEGNSLFD